MAASGTGLALGLGSELRAGATVRYGLLEHMKSALETETEQSGGVAAHSGGTGLHGLSDGSTWKVSLVVSMKGSWLTQGLQWGLGRMFGVVLGV